MVPTSAAEGRGHGKLILFGEHAVVYGHPALVAGLERGVTARARRCPPPTTLRLRGPFGLAEEVSPDPGGAPLARSLSALLEVLRPPGPLGLEADLELWPGAGLGSSAALAAALARAIAPDGEEALLEQAVEASEQVFHGHPSGVDQAAALRGGLIRFERPAPGHPPLLRPLERPPGATPLTLAVCLAAPGASTAEMVAAVGARHRRHPQATTALFRAIGELAEEADALLASTDPTVPEELGELMDINHGALAALGVSTAALDAACHLARGAGALGAKLTGAGGGGCVFALARPEDDGAVHVLAAWREGNFGDAFAVVI